MNTFIYIALLLLGITIHNGTYYKKYPLKIDKSEFPNVNTNSEIEILAEKLVSEMTLKEKIDQMYGEKNLLQCQSSSSIY